MNRSFTAPIIVVVSILLFAGVLLTQPSVSRNKKAVKENDKVETPFLPEESGPVESGSGDFSGLASAGKKGLNCDQACISWLQPGILRNLD